MPYFHYSATDRQGKSHDGTLQAADEEAARIALTLRGLTPTFLQDSQTAAQSARAHLASAPPPPARSRQPLQQIILDQGAGSGVQGPVGPVNPPPPQPTPQRPAPGALRPPSPVHRPPAPAPQAPQSAPTLRPIRTRLGSDKDRFFLFAQLAAAMRAGINPAQAFTDVARRSRAYYSGSLTELASAATQGQPLADTMARYPDLYPEHVVGLVRAGQNGGFLEEAFEEISGQAESAHKFKRWFFWIWFVAINALLAIPGSILAGRAIVRSWELTDARGGQGGFSEALKDVGRAYGQLLIWPLGPIFLAVWGGLWIARRYLSSRRAKRFRHRLGLRFPVYGPRARHENLARFSWTMSRLARSGLAPATAWALAADAVPNLAMRDMLAGIGGRMHGAERMSDVLNSSGLFPEEYAPIVATAEYTGDIPGALQRLADSSRTEFETATSYAKARSGCWGALGCFVTAGAMLAILMYAWYHELPKKVLEGFGD